MIKSLIHRLCFIMPFILWFVVLAGPLGVNEPTVFQTPNGMGLQVQFWINVFTRYSNDQVIIHDSENPERIYRVLHMAQMKGSKKAAQQYMKHEKADVRRLLNNLASKRPDPDKMSPEEKRIWLLWGKESNRQVYARAAERLRIQGGMKETFREGIVRSGRYLPVIRQVLKREGLPEELAYLCHVESSFHPGARSKSSAVGMWQFTRGTGRQFMKINSQVDERLDPVLSTVAAAKLLKENYMILRSWPLAVTAYNHGLGGMKRAKTRLRTTNMKRIIDQYKSRSFGFASKNFYAEFLAAVHVAQNAENYFGKIHMDDPVDFMVTPLPKAMTLPEMSQQLKIKKETLLTLNPAFLKPVRKGTHKVHQGYRLRLPRKHSVPSQFLALNPTEPIESSLAWNIKKESIKKDVMAPRKLKKEDRVVTQIAALNVIPEKAPVPFLPKEPVSYQVDLDGKALQRQYEYQALHFDAYRKNLNVVQGRIIVQPEETLGHYAEWLGVPTNTLRRLNGLSYRQNIRMGQRIKLAFHQVNQNDFYRQRVDYHQMLVNHYFEKHRVTQAVEHQVQKGESLWSVAYHRFDVPVWLVLAYNSWDVPRRLAPGDKIRVPLVERVSPTT